MSTKLLTGLLLIAAGAFSSGSFAIPFGKIRHWHWESYWMIYSLGAYILFPLLACLILAPGFMDIYKMVPAVVLLKVFLLGAVYGIGNLAFGLSLRYLGISLGYALSLGLMLAIGTLVPPVIDGRLSQMISSSGGDLLIFGVIVACAGIGLSGLAGYMKDRKVSDLKKQKSLPEFDFVKGILAALLVGVTGSAMSLGFEQGIPIAESAGKAGVNELFITMPVMLLLLAGTMVTTAVWCIYLGKKHSTLSDYLPGETPKIVSFNYMFSLLAGFLWFIQFILFGMGKSKMGEYTFTSWGILMALTIFFATVWGLYRKEWKGATLKIYAIMVFSLLVIVISSFLIGISGSR
jgi:L-rhamnose-H+ transport protein